MDTKRLVGSEQERRRRLRLYVAQASIERQLHEAVPGATTLAEAMDGIDEATFDSITARAMDECIAADVIGTSLERAGAGPMFDPDAVTGPIQ